MPSSQGCGMSNANSLGAGRRICCPVGSHCGSVLPVAPQHDDTRHGAAHPDAVVRLDCEASASPGWFAGPLSAGPPPPTPARLSFPTSPFDGRRGCEPERAPLRGAPACSVAPRVGIPPSAIPAYAGLLHSHQVPLPKSGAAHQALRPLVTAKLSASWPPVKVLS